jgi:predicted nucleic acid-binding protein
VIRYLVDSSALWRMRREPAVQYAWANEIDLRLVGSCAPQRTEFRRSAIDLAEYERFGRMFADLFPDVPLPKRIWSWIESAQHRLAEGGGTVRALSTVDLMICATAAHHGLTILHDDGDFVTAAGYFPDLRQRCMREPRVGRE